MGNGDDSRILQLLPNAVNINRVSQSKVMEPEGENIHTFAEFYRRCRNPLKQWLRP